MWALIDISFVTLAESHLSPSILESERLEELLSFLANKDFFVFTLTALEVFRLLILAR